MDRARTRENRRVGNFGIVSASRVAAATSGSANVAVEKARTSALSKRPSKAFQDTIAAAPDGVRVLSLKGVVALEGGIPLVQDGRIVGAIGVSGATSAQDGQCAKAGADALK